MAGLLQANTCSGRLEVLARQSLVSDEEVRWAIVFLSPTEVLAVLVSLLALILAGFFNAIGQDLWELVKKQFKRPARKGKD